LARRPDEIAGSRQCRIHPVGARPHPEPAHPLKQIDWYRAVILTTAPDVLLVIVVMFAAGAATSHLLFRKSPMARAIARVGFLILL
jgi:hypothetical protein